MSLKQTFATRVASLALFALVTAAFVVRAQTAPESAQKTAAEKVDGMVVVPQDDEKKADRGSFRPDADYISLFSHVSDEVLMKRTIVVNEADRRRLLQQLRQREFQMREKLSRSMQEKQQETPYKPEPKPKATPLFEAP